MITHHELFAAVVHVARGPEGRVPSDLMSAAYRASRRQAVLLVLDAVTRAEADAALDACVASSGRAFRGVRYAEVNDDEVVAAAARSRVYAGKGGFRDKLAQHGIVARATDELKNDLRCD